MGAEWEVFDGKDGPIRGCFVTVSADHALLLSTEAMAALGHPEAAHLLYDARRRRVGIRAARVDAPGAYKLSRSSRRGRNGILSATRFLRHYDLNPSPGRRAATLEGGILAFSLDGGEGLARTGDTPPVETPMNGR